jgi:copper resistance protein B
MAITLRALSSCALLIAALAATAQAQTAPVPTPTEEERKAAFPPDLQGHAVHDTGLHVMVLVDQLEGQWSGETGALWDMKTWIGGDTNRLWIRSEADYSDGTFDDAEAHVVLGRNVSRWWSLVGGMRQDFTPGPQRTWAAIGVQGLAPQWFDVEATAYLGESARTAARLEVEYDLLLTDRLIVQPLLEMNLFGKSDPERLISAGLSTVEFGARLRYEIRRELAPYAGLVWHRKLFETADLATEHGHDVGGWRFVSGLRFWF